eukprot:8115168-Pyramimonas_sp.AAC.2
MGCSSHRTLYNNRLPLGADDRLSVEHRQARSATQLTQSAGAALSGVCARVPRCSRTSMPANLTISWLVR